MHKIKIKKFLIIVFSIIICFSIILGFVMKVFIDKSLKTENNTSYNNTDLYRNNQNASKDEQTNFEEQLYSSTEKNNFELPEIKGLVNEKNINALVKAQKYSLMTQGVFDKNKLNRFVEDNINMVFLDKDSIILYKLADLNRDGINEISIMYEMETTDQNKYLMISALRWEDGKFIKDIDKVLKENDYNIESNDIVVGDIIIGGNSEFIFIQKDNEGIKGSKMKVLMLFDTGFYDFYTHDSKYELEIQDFNGDGRLELYTSLIDANGIKHMSWTKWNGEEFIEYNKAEQPVVINP